MRHSVQSIVCSESVAQYAVSEANTMGGPEFAPRLLKLLNHFDIVSNITVHPPVE